MITKTCIPKGRYYPGAPGILGVKPMISEVKMVVQRASKRFHRSAAIPAGAGLAAITCRLCPGQSKRHGYRQGAEPCSTPNLHLCRPQNAITITLFSNSAIAANVAYNDPAKAVGPNGVPTPQNTIFYYDSTAIGYLTMGEFADANGNIPLSGVVANAQLTISEMTTGYVKGTFSGTVYKSSTLTQYYSITEGEFYLKRS